jgi:MFS family permease
LNKLNIIIQTLHTLKTSVNRKLEIDEEKILSQYLDTNIGKPGIAIKALAVFGGIAASLFFLAFLFLAGLYESETAMLIFGVIFIVAAIFVNSRFDNLVVDTASISFFLAGFFLLGVGLGSIHINENMICLVFVSVALLTMIIIQNYIFSFISVLIINGSLLALIMFSRSNNIIHLLLITQVVAIVYLFLHESFFISAGSKISKLYQPVRTGTLISFLCGLVFIARKDLVSTGPYFLLATSVMIIIALLYLAFHLLAVLKVIKLNDKMLVYGIAALMFIPTIMAPAISGCLLVILLSFFVQHRGGFILGIGALIYFISQYYYDLEYSLLHKSYFLMGSGILFILIYLVTIKKLVANAKT